MITFTAFSSSENIETLLPNPDARVVFGRFACAALSAADVASPTNRFFVLRNGDDVIGVGAFYSIDWIARSAELRLCVSRDAHPALRALTEYGAKMLQLHRIAIWFSSRDRSSAALAKRAGYKDDGRLRDYFYAEGGYSDLLIKSYIGSIDHE